ncbi:MAG TPA: transglycosylase SLT domain-containing protein [Oscillatoriaceae cyanobacterium]
MLRPLATLIAALGLVFTQARPIALTPPLPRPTPHVVAERQTVFAFIRSHAGMPAAERYTDLIVAKARAHQIPALLVAKVVNRESSFHADAHNGACSGLMQVAYFHFRHGLSPTRPADNLEVGCSVLAGYKKRFGSWPVALTAYNFGPGATASRGLGTSRYARLVLAGR